MLMIIVLSQKLDNQAIEITGIWDTLGDIREHLITYLKSSNKYLSALNDALKSIANYMSN